MAKKDNLTTSIYFQSPIYTIEIPEWVDHVNKVCNNYIKKSKKINEPMIKDREKRWKKKVGDITLSHHSESMINNSELKEFQQYIGSTSWNVMDFFGYDMSQYELMWTELWCQEFSKKGGGHHEGHIHYDNHISGFYFLKCSDRTSVPYFKDPRLAKVMADLPLKKQDEVSMASPLIQYKPKPGTMIFFPSYLEHGFTVDAGVDDFRFVHFNLQAVRKLITEHLRNENGKNKR
jgi:uncharacterized protein (TIGR02466 family)|tara:strand:+ start:96 stop:794 length:699 start_codon:yes stop_codon:yes gene_type:complete